MGGCPYERRTILRCYKLVPSTSRGQNALRLVSRGSVALVYLGYLGLLAWLAWHRMGQFWPALVVPAAAFVVGTLVRRIIDRPRPYTALGFTPLFPKDKPGQSMPSRHCFSAAAIAGAAWFVIRPLGLALAVLAVVIAVCRVVTGVHYISDVLAGAGLRRGVRSGGLERLCAGCFRGGLLRNYAFIKGSTYEKTLFGGTVRAGGIGLDRVQLSGCYALPLRRRQLCEK